MSKLIIVDGNSIAYRAFFALPPLSNSSGLQTNAVYGFTTILLKLLEEQKPTHFLVAFDAGKVTFRHTNYKDYKGGRAKTPPELSEQFPVLKDLIRAFGVSQFEIDGYEADDIIGTLTRIADEMGNFEVIVVSGDKDMLQLASNHVKIALTRKGISDVEMYDPPYIMEKYGLTPNQIIDLKGLMGDASDNIPGIPGVGEKTALKLLLEYGSVEGVLANTDQLKGKMKEKIVEHADDARMSKELATIFREVPLDSPWEDMAYKGFEKRALAEMLHKLEFKSLMEKLNLSGSDMASQNQEPQADIQTIAIEGLQQLAEVTDVLDDVQSIHVEVIGENPHVGYVLGLALHTDKACYYVPFELLKEQSHEVGLVKAWLESADKSIAIYDQHKAEIALSWQGIELRGISFDVLLAAYLLDPTESALTLHGLLVKYSLPSLKADEDIFSKGAKFKIPAIEVVSDHLCRKANAVHSLLILMKQDLQEKGMDQLFYDLELPLACVLAAMEHKGIKVDADGLRQYSVELAGQLDKIMRSIYEEAGMEFNINSTKQLGDVLFDKLKLPTDKKTKTGYSTNVEVLEKLEPYHPIISHILHYRTLAKLQSTYVEGLLKEIRPETGKVHTYYRQTIAATGRLSSQFPNLQNIPIRLEEGRKIRKFFVPSQPGWSILTADYSQIELRVLAHISQDKNLMEAFLNDMDIHTKTAMDVFGVAESAVDSNMRRQAKAVNFGIVYGISDYGLSQNLNITRKDASTFIEQYFAVFGGVRRFMDDVVKQARIDGYVTTLLNRRRYLPEINASNFNLRSFAERTAMNTPIQGTAADVIKLAMVQMDERMKKDGLASRMLLQVHDELVFEVPENEIQVMRDTVKEVMEAALQLDVPLKVDVDTGSNWYEAK
ncbi:DNA polymerase I [Paenibacillus agricola]|uniref:DNA polymerase I n=1 Tax=Paenibacillus agricola TaxID=2716264 RepID=A0ABX0J952_9BACL|nr:DNA polymerase I [Paenibacillus agricola]NHN31392.1 DNA polymerase I [Paenibacillus agricola]